jgi:hypothetical protein
MAKYARHFEDELSVVVALPDGSPCWMPVSATDVLGPPESGARPSLVLSALGLRHLRALVGTRLEAAGPLLPGQPKLWKVVRHRHGADPYVTWAEICSSYTGEAAARRSAEKERASFVRSAGHKEAANWSWSPVFDPAGMVAGTPRPPRRQR